MWWRVTLYRCAGIIAILQHCHYMIKYVFFSTSNYMNSLSFILISISIARQYTNRAHILYVNLYDLVNDRSAKPQHNKMSVLSKLSRFYFSMLKSIFSFITRRLHTSRGSFTHITHTLTAIGQNKIGKELVHMVNPGQCVLC